jgi:hypothetical protein
MTRWSKIAAAADCLALVNAGAVAPGGRVNFV